ncbi:MAG TPA: glycosyltransferase, partial [Segetibacter sp.]
AIPTYNRPNELADTLAGLIPQVTDEVVLMILDNCSETNIAPFLKTKFDDADLKKLKIIRHRTNIGADANFARCFELCDTPYIWMLSDDDEIVDNAVQLILKEIQKFQHLDLIGINFNSSLCTATRTKPVIINNKTELIEKLDHFWNWVFISTSIYKTEEYVKYLRYTAWGAYSMVSQLLPAIMAIHKNNKVFILSDTLIVNNLYGEAPAWSRLQLNLGLTSILELPINFEREEYLAFGKKFSVEFVPVRSVFLYLLKSINWNIDLIDKYHIYIFKQLFYRSYEFRYDRYKEYIKFHLLLFLLYNKLLIKLLIKFLPVLKRRGDNLRPFFLFER